MPLGKRNGTFKIVYKEFIVHFERWIIIFRKSRTTLVDRQQLSDILRIVSAHCFYYK